MTVQRAQSPGHLAWLDLEMTGLDAERDVILQCALVITNAELVPLEEWVVDVWQPPAALATMSPFVREMHTTTGLLARVEASTVDLARAEKALLERISGWCPYPAVLCGNTIGTDRRFVDRWMPGLSTYLHYRSVDVSSIKVLARLWYGDAAVFDKPEQGKHDALVDIRNSIAELAFYRHALFRTP
ncbi:MAG: oligoribonuclease [Polyangiaceae bacterium]|nr:oligoribonuclease [Polyangiaceae bacterium]